MANQNNIVFGPKTSEDLAIIRSKIHNRYGTKNVSFHIRAAVAAMAAMDEPEILAAISEHLKDEAGFAAEG